MNNNIYIKKINTTSTDLTKDINRALRDFNHNTDMSYVLLHITKTSTFSYTDEELKDISERFVNTLASTGIHFFAGSLTPHTVIEYKETVKLSIGSIMEQVIDTLFFTRDIINEVGYFDVRYTDNCAFGDYAVRAGKTALYPEISDNKLPWLFDIAGVEKHRNTPVFDRQSSGWYQYKYKNFPQNLSMDTVTNLKPSLKKLV